MRYKNNVLNKLDQVDATVLRVEFGVNRRVNQDEILNVIEQLKDQLTLVREMISVEPDDLERQF